MGWRTDSHYRELVIVGIRVIEENVDCVRNL